MKNKKIFSAKLIIIPVIVAITTITATTTLAQPHEGEHILLASEGMVWVNGPPSLPEGAEFAVIEGDPSEEGPFTMRLKMPEDYRISPHSHPAVEHVTVISGSFYMGLGDEFDETVAEKMVVGGFAVMDVGTQHFAYTDEESVIQLHGIGPWEITYVNSSEDPRTE